MIEPRINIFRHCDLCTESVAAREEEAVVILALTKSRDKAIAYFTPLEARELAGLLVKKAREAEDRLRGGLQTKDKLAQ